MRDHASCVTLYLLFCAALLAPVATAAPVVAIGHYEAAPCTGTPLYLLPGGGCTSAAAPATCAATQEPGDYQQMTCVDLVPAPAASSVLVPASFAASGPTLAFALGGKCQVSKAKQQGPVSLYG